MKCVTTIMIAGAFLLSACETTTPPAPYKAPVRNLVQYQKVMSSRGLKARVDYLSTAKGVNLAPNCRLLGPSLLPLVATPCNISRKRWKKNFLPPALMT